MRETDPLSHLSNERLVELAQSDRTPLTKGQRAQATLDRRSDIQRAFRRFRTETLIGFVILLLGLSLGTYTINNENEAARQAIQDSANAVSVSNCNERFKVSLTQRRELVLARDIPLDEAVRLTPMPDCRKANIVTDDPAADIRKQRPFHPGLLRGQLEWE